MDSLITLTGYVGNDVEYVVGDGWVAARFRLGCTPHWRKGNEWVNGVTTWMSIRTSGATADNVRDSVRKGDPMVVTGRLRTRTWEDANHVHREQIVVEAYSLGHDLARGVSTYIRPVRASVPVIEEEPLGPSEEDLLNGAKPNMPVESVEDEVSAEDAPDVSGDDATAAEDLEDDDMDQ